MRCKVDDVKQLEKLLKLFFKYQRPEITAFRKAVEQFKTDMPAVLKSLREMIEGAEADKDSGCIILDTETMLTGIPKEAWDYKLGNRSALEWILDQYKETKPKDLTIREKFNTYRFADYKDHVTDLLMRVTRVSVETMKIIEQMRLFDHGF